MSVATDLVPVVYIPPQARRASRPDAVVVQLHQPADVSIARPLRLTRRGLCALSAVVAALAGGLVLLASLSVPEAAAKPAPVPVAVTVHSGDTLWALASRIAPDRDPRAEVATLRRLNHLTGADLVPGQVLRTK